MRCYAHSDREALGACIGCGKGVCLDCLNRISGKMYCNGCVIEREPSTNSLQNLQQRADYNLQKYAPREVSTMLVSTDRNRYLAAILSITFGTFGVHKFYVGQTGWGIAYFLFSWTGIPTLAAFVETLLYLVRSEEDFTRRYGRTVPTMQRPELNGSFDYARRQVALPRPPKTLAEHERLLLKVAREQKGLISVPHLLMEHHLKLENVESALASLSVQGLVQSDFDESGHVRYFVTEFLC